MKYELNQFESLPKIEIEVRGLLFIHPIEKVIMESLG